MVITIIRQAGLINTSQSDLDSVVQSHQIANVRVRAILASTHGQRSRTGHVLGVECEPLAVRRYANHYFGLGHTKPVPVVGRPLGVERNGDSSIDGPSEECTVVAHEGPVPFVHVKVVGHQVDKVHVLSHLGGNVRRVNDGHLGGHSSAQN